MAFDFLKKALEKKKASQAPSQKTRGGDQTAAGKSQTNINKPGRKSSGRGR